MKRYNKKFNSLHEVSAFIASTPVNGWFADNFYNRSRDCRKNFDGVETHEEATNLMLGGWSDGAKRIQAFMTSGSVGVAPVRRVVNSVVGFAPNVPAAIAGRPLNMRKSIKVNQPRRVVSLVYNCTVDSSVNTSDIERNAAKLFNVICGLERSGVRVELWACVASCNDSKKHAAACCAAVRIKSADQPLNVFKMCYPVVHPAMLRQHFLSVFERMNVKEKFQNHGYPIISESDIKTAVSSTGVPSDNIVSYYSLVGKSESEILNLIK